MKDAVLRFIDTLRNTFSERRSHMTGARFHAPFVKEIKADEDSLVTLNTSVSLLKEEKTSQFSALMLYLIIDSVVPLLRKWRGRFVAIKEHNQDDNSNHIKAYQEFEQQKLSMFELITQLNHFEDTKLIELESSDSITAVAIISKFNRESFATKYQLSSLLECPVSTEAASLSKAHSNEYN